MHVLQLKFLYFPFSGICGTEFQVVNVYFSLKLLYFPLEKIVVVENVYLYI